MHDKIDKKILKLRERFSEKFVKYWDRNNLIKEKMQTNDMSK
jgi:hypothetical protein